MVKKILGAVLVLYGIFFIARVADINAVDTTLPTAGSYMFGQYLSTVGIGLIYLLASIPLFLFDNVYKKSYIEGFRTRKKQCAVTIALLIVLTIPTIFMAFSVGMIFGTMSAQTEFSAMVVPTFFASLLVVLLPGLIYSSMCDVYVWAYMKCKKYFMTNDSIAASYLSAPYKSYSENNFVLANNDLLFFPKLYCVIPKNQIESIKESNQLVYKQVTFRLTNGKKIKMITRQYNNIMRAYNSAN